MEERLYFTDDDLKNAVKEFTEKYFYDFPLIIHDVYFGKNSTSWLGQCVPLRGIPTKDVVLQNIDKIDNKSEIIDSDIEVNGYLKELDVTETLLHEMCHAVNFTMGDYSAKHGKLFKDVAKIISDRSGYDIHTTSGDEHLNSVLSSIEYLKKVRKNNDEVLSLRKTIKSWYDKYEDIYVKVIDELNDIKKGLGDIVDDLIKNGNVEDKDSLNEYADKVEDLLGTKIWRLWNWS